MLLQPRVGATNPGPVVRLRVVGIARDTKTSSGVVRDGGSAAIAEGPGLLMYRPLQQHFVRSVTLITRASGGQRVAAGVRSAVAAMDPNLPIVSTQRLDEPSGPVQLQLRIAASVSGSLGAVGLLLAAIGIYGVTAYAVTCRTREIGIRVAMGAQRADIIGMVLRHGLWLVAIGSAIGLALAAATSRLLTRLLFGVPPIDPVTFAGAAALFAAVGLTACYLPAYRAARVDPVVALRQE
jgi:putative ABC transport system permease protein